MAEVFNVFKERKSTYNSGGRDSLVKIIDVYFSSVTAETFEFNGKIYEPQDLRVSPDIMRGFTCPSQCGGCCRDLSLDYIEHEVRPYEMTPRNIKFNGKDFEVYTDFNDDEVKDAGGRTVCKHLSPEGRCGIHMKHPFSCDFELLRFVVPQKITNTRPVKLNHQKFGRGWQMKRVDGSVGALCEMINRTEDDRKTSIRKLERLQEWTDHFGLKTVLPRILTWLRNVDLNDTKALYIYQKNIHANFMD